MKNVWTVVEKIREEENKFFLQALQSDSGEEIDSLAERLKTSYATRHALETSTSSI